jgi:hypothetical protein
MAVSMNSAELRANRRNTKAFIAADPVELVLYRQEIKRTSGGNLAKVGEPVPLAPQTFRMLPQGSAQADVRNTSGKLAPQTYVLMGEWDADMARDDTFTHNGVDYTLEGIIGPEHSDDSVYERKAPVKRNG